MFKLRPYQQKSVEAVLQHFRRRKDPAVLVLPTGAGKSLIIADIARLAKGRVLVLAHVKELVEQNHGKYESYGVSAGIFSAGLGRRDTEQKVVFGGIQSVARADDDFFTDFSILIIDECHRVSENEDSQYHQVITKLRRANPSLCILGLTATPYRMGTGWIYQYHQDGFLRTQEKKFFKKCVYETTLAYMIDHDYLTVPVKIDAPVACYDFSDLKLSESQQAYSSTEIQRILKEQARLTPGIVNHILKISEDRRGVMLFTSSVEHARELLDLLPDQQSALVIGDTDIATRDQIIQDFKDQKIKFLVNVSVLTTGFDAPHVDLIALLRPTESVGLFQQIVGRGLRLFPDKEDCLILDYTGQGHDLYAPEVGEKRPSEDSIELLIACPQCGHDNVFWGRVDQEGCVLEHYGRKCRGAFEDPVSGEIDPCNYRFRFKICKECGEENDIAARQCCSCRAILVDPDDKLKKAMELKDAHVMRPDTMQFVKEKDKKKKDRLVVSYYDFDAKKLSEYYYFDTPSQIKAFHYNFAKIHTRVPGFDVPIKTIDDAITNQEMFRSPRFVIARKKKYFWEIREKIF